jgi:hypothetical protein
MLLVKKTEKTKKTSSAWQRGAGTLFLCLRATGETKKLVWSPWSQRPPRFLRLCQMHAFSISLKSSVPKTRLWTWPWSRVYRLIRPSHPRQLKSSTAIEILDLEQVNMWHRSRKYFGDRTPCKKSADLHPRQGKKNIFSVVYKTFLHFTK